MEAMRYPPHITLAIYDNAESQELADAVDSVFKHREGASIRFDGLGLFDTPSAIVVWAKPQLPGWIREAHEAIHSRLDARRCRENYRPGRWRPHCSLALAVDVAKRNEAIALAERSVVPFDVLFDVADCATFPPVKVLHEVHLRGA